MIEYKVNTLSLQVLVEHLELCDSSYIPPLSQRTVLDEYAKKIRSNACTFEAWSGERLLGVVCTYLNTVPYGYITDVSVKPEAIGKGLARNLLSSCIEAARLEFGMSGLKLDVSKFNIKALRIYQRLGFEIESECDQIVKMKLIFEEMKDDR